MGMLRFGKEETITCIVDVPVKAEGNSLCLAYKTTTHWLGGGIWVSNDGYVLKPTSLAGIYYKLEPAALEGKVESIPYPLPAYTVPKGTYVMGFSLWWAIALTVAWGLGVRLFRRRRQAAFEATQQTMPIDHGPPRLDTTGDRWLYEMARTLVAPGESVQHQAYVHSWDYTNERAGDDAFFLVVTTARLFIITTRVGAFGILYENNKVDVIDRHAIDEAVVGHGKVLFVTTSGVQRGYIIKSTRALSNQTAFLHNAARVLATRASAPYASPAMGMAFRESARG